MAVSTGVWIAYTFVNSCGTGLSFTELMNSDEFDRALTCGAVYGFAAGIVAFLCSYLGERSLGHQDPGATSSWYMLRTMAEHIDE